MVSGHKPRDGYRHDALACPVAGDPVTPDDFAQVAAHRAAMPRGGPPSGNRASAGPAEAQVPSAHDVYVTPDPWGGDLAEDAIFSDDVDDAADYDPTEDSQ